MTVSPGAAGTPAANGSLQPGPPDLHHTQCMECTVTVTYAATQWRWTGENCSIIASS